MTIKREDGVYLRWLLPSRVSDLLTMITPPATPMQHIHIAC